MKILILLFSFSVVYTAQNCRQVPKEQSQKVCQMKDLLIANQVEQCKDVIVKRCKEQFVPIPLVPFRSSRIVGKTTSLVVHGDGSGTHYEKRADRIRGLSTGRTCEEVKEKKCTKVPEERIVPSKICKNMVSTVYVEECDPVEEATTQKIEKLVAVQPKILAVAEPTQKIEKLVAIQPTILAVTAPTLAPEILSSNKQVIVIQEPESVVIAPEIRQEKLKIVKATTGAPTTKAPRKVTTKTPRKKLAKKRPTLNIQFTTARTYIQNDAEYSDIENKVAEAKATIRNVRKAVANKNIDFSDAKLQIQGVLKVLNALADKTEVLES